MYPAPEAPAAFGGAGPLCSADLVPMLAMLGEPKFQLFAASPVPRMHALTFLDALSCRLYPFPYIYRSPGHHVDGGSSAEIFVDRSAWLRSYG
jgi:hypothetical protein